MTAASAAPGDSVLALADRLLAEGRDDDALTLYGHLLTGSCDRPHAWTGFCQALIDRGDTLGGLRALAAARDDLQDLAPLTPQVQALLQAGAAAFNACVALNDVAGAAPYASAMAVLTPQSAQRVTAAMACHQTLGNMEEAVQFARMLHVLDPDHITALTLLADQARDDGDVETEIRHRVTLGFSPDPAMHPLMRLRELHDGMSLLLCRSPLSQIDLELLRRMEAAARAFTGDVPEESEWSGWIKAYRLLTDALDIPSIVAPTPPRVPDPAPVYCTATGEALDDPGLRALADRLGVQAVFFAAADEKYVALYARWYALSVLRHCDVPCLVVIHVIGGAGRLAQAIATVGIEDERVVFVGDDFDASSVTIKVYDSPPKGLIALPVAHFQSVRFQRLGALLEVVARPIFVSDIDLLLQRGVADLLAQHAGADVVFNENFSNTSVASRLTANLLLVQPSAGAAVLLDYLRAYLDKHLAKASVTRWIDQVALTMARHHLRHHHPQARLGLFDTASDINNVMFDSYQAHPFRFLSLYHGFDTSSLENDPRVLG